MYSFSADYPELSLKIRCDGAADEHFHLACAGSHVELKASSPQVVNFALSQLASAIESNQLGDIIGENRPLYPVRALWITSGKWCRLPDGLTLFLPNWENLKSAVSLGVNLLIFAEQNARHVAPEPIAQERAEELLGRLKAAGLKIALQVDPANGFTNKIFTSCLDYLVFHEEVASSPLPVIHYATDSLLKHSRSLKAASIVAFPAYQSDSLHPIYSELSQRAVSEKTRLMPLLTFESLQLEDGRTLREIALNRIENALGRNLNGRFAGAAVVAADLGDPSELATCPLWIAGQRMWRQLCVQALFECWLARFHPAWQPLCQKRGFLEHLTELFYLLQKEEVESTVQELVTFGQMLASFKEERRFQESIADLTALSNLLLEFQKALKGKLEAISSKKVAKIPLALQNFQPIQF